MGPGGLGVKKWEGEKVGRWEGGWGSGRFGAVGIGWAWQLGVVRWQRDIAVLRGGSAADIRLIIGPASGIVKG